jgi:hypothetical protein
MNAAHRSIQPDAVGGMLAVVGSAFIGVGAAQTAGLHQDVWSNPWFDGGCAIVATGLLIAISVIVSWWHSRRRRRASTASPLLLLPGSEKSRIFDSSVWAIGLALHIFRHLTTAGRSAVRQQRPDMAQPGRRDPATAHGQPAVRQTKAKTHVTIGSHQNDRTLTICLVSSMRVLLRRSVHYSERTPGRFWLAASGASAVSKLGAV